MMHDEHKKPANEVQWRGCLLGAERGNKQVAAYYDLYLGL